MSKPIRVLFIDDDAEALEALVKIARAQEWDVLTSASAKDAESIVDEHAVDVVVSDYLMPGRDGIDLLASLRATHPKIARVLMSGQSSREMAAEAVINGGAHAVITKPWRLQHLVATVRTAATHARSLNIAAEPDLKSAVRTFKR